MTDTRKLERVEFMGQPMWVLAGVRCPECGGVVYPSPVDAGFCELHEFTCSMPEIAPR